MKSFEFKMPTKVRFGMGIGSEVGQMIKKEGFHKVFIATGKHVGVSEIMDQVIASLNEAGLEYVLYKELLPDPTIEQVDEVAQVLKDSGADVVLAVGGGSPIDTAKAICVLQTHEGSIRDYLFGGSRTVERPTMPLICIPTTAGTGSEVTASSVITDTQNKIKLSVTNEYLIPRLAVIDPTLQTGMPPFITATTGMDALTHAIECYVSLNAEPFSDALAIEAIRIIGANLRTAVADGSNLEARANMAIASTMAGIAFFNGGLGVVHGIAQSMGGVAHVSHGAANALILPYAMERNEVGNLTKFKNIAEALGENTEGLSLREAASLAAEAVHSLAADIGVPTKLTDERVKITKEMFPEIIKGTMEYRLLAINPCKLTEADVTAILEAAYE